MSLKLWLAKEAEHKILHSYLSSRKEKSTYSEAQSRGYFLTCGKRF